MERDKNVKVEARNVMDDGFVQVDSVLGYKDIAGAIYNHTCQNLMITFPPELGVEPVLIEDQGWFAIPMDPDGMVMLGAFAEGNYEIQEAPEIDRDFDFEQ